MRSPFLLAHWRDAILNDEFSTRSNALLAPCRNFEEIGNVQQPEHDTDQRGHVAPLRIIEYSGTSELEASPHGFELATALRENIFDPLTFASIRQCNDDTMTPAKHDDRRPVSTMGSSSDVYDDAHPRHVPR